MTAGWRRATLAAPSVIPVINYGAIGTNLFEGFDCAYCLTGYYVTEQVVNAVVQDVLAADGHIPIRIRTGGTPRRRTAEVVSATDRVYDVARLAHLALGQQELDVVIQAVGRVRPYTRPREVVTFQCSARPDGDYDREFGTSRRHAPSSASRPRAPGGATKRPPACGLSATGARHRPSRQNRWA